MEIKGIITNPKNLIISDPWYIGQKGELPNYVAKMPDGEYTVHIRTRQETITDEELGIKYYEAVFCEMCITRTPLIELCEDGTYRYAPKVMQTKQVSVGVDTAEIYIGASDVVDADEMHAAAISTGADGYCGEVIEFVGTTAFKYRDNATGKVELVQAGKLGIVANFEFPADIVSPSQLIATLPATLGITDMVTLDTKKISAKQ